MPYYMKAYPLGRLRAFPGWKDPPGEALSDDDIVFVRQDLVVARNSVSADGRVIFDEITDGWRAFCREELLFAVPAWSAE